MGPTTPKQIMLYIDASSALMPQVKTNQRFAYDE